MTWLTGVTVLDLTGRSNGAGNGPFGGANAGKFLGIVLHCNGSVGADTADSWFAAGGGPDSVCPNFQVHADGSISQYLPLEWSPWCQADGNANYAAIETAGGPDPLTTAQLASVAKIVGAYHDVMGMPLQLAEAPGQQGFGYHAMGGAAWGGHPCPLPARIAQRAQIISLASSSESTLSNGASPIGDQPMSADEVAELKTYIYTEIVQAVKAETAATQRIVTDGLNNIKAALMLNIRDSFLAAAGQKDTLPDGTKLTDLTSVWHRVYDEFGKVEAKLADLAASPTPGGGPSLTVSQITTAAQTGAAEAINNTKLVTTGGN